MYVYAYMLDFFSLFNNIHFFLVPHISLPEPNQSNSNLKHTRVFIHWIQNFRGHSFWTECNFPFFFISFSYKRAKDIVCVRVRRLTSTTTWHWHCLAWVSLFSVLFQYGHIYYVFGKPFWQYSVFFFLSFLLQKIFLFELNFFPSLVSRQIGQWEKFEFVWVIPYSCLTWNGATNLFYLWYHSGQPFVDSIITHPFLYRAEVKQAHHHRRVAVININNRNEFDNVPGPEVCDRRVVPRIIKLLY